MKNKEIEEILNYMKQKQYISETNINFGYKTMSAGQVDLLLSYIEQLEKENQQLKKQKDDVVEYIKKHIQEYDVDGSPTNLDEFDFLASPKTLLRMLGEIDD